MASTISVASSVYSLAGDESSQPNFLRMLVMRGVLSNDRKTSLGEIISKGYITGRGIKMRGFFRWADINYDYLGLPGGSIAAGNNVSPSLIAAHIPVTNGSANVTDAVLTTTNFAMYVERWFLANDPDNYMDGEGPWTADISNSNTLITIRYDNGTVVTFNPTGFVENSRVIYAHYTELKMPSYGPITVGSPISLGPDDNFPSLTNYGEVSSAASQVTVDLAREETVTLSYSDGRPDEVTVTDQTFPATYDVRTRVYHWDEPKADDPGPPVRKHMLRHILNLYENAEVIEQTTTTTRSQVIEGVTVTTTTTVVEEVISYLRSYREDLQDVFADAVSPPRVFIYTLGSGNPDLDAVEGIVTSYGRFYPIIPIRINNTNVSASNNPTLYKQAKEATKRGLGNDGYDQLLSEIAKNPDVGDIDYAYLVFGVALNTTNKGGKKYIYAFLKRMMSQGNSIRIATNGAGAAYDMRISWDSISESFSGGLGRAGAKKGDIWTTSDGDDGKKSVFKIILPTSNFWIYHQYEDNAYSVIYVRNLLHTNNIYKNKTVLISAHQARTDGDVSGFIIPLHIGTYREMSLVDSTQLASSLGYLVFNSYVEKKKKWWQSGFFSFLFVIFIAVISVVFTGGAGIGLLGAHMAVGGALGLTGMAAAIAGSIANALAAMVLTMVISQVATLVFGDALGPIIGALISMAVMNLAINFHTTGALNFNFNSLFSAENLLKLTNAGVDAYTAMVQANIMDMQMEMQTLQEKTDAELKRIREAYGSEFGFGGGQIDPLMFVGNSPVMAESRDTFLSRTLLTGTQIADLSFSMITDFTELSLTLPDAYT